MCNYIMTRAALLFLLTFSLYACVQGTGNKQQQAHSENKKNGAKEVWTIYNRQDTIVHVKRLVDMDSGLTLLTYYINVSHPMATEQVFVSSKKLAGNNEAVAEKAQNTNYTWTPYKSKTILFVQVAPSAFKDEMEALDKRQDIEDKIDKALQAEGVGEWIAGDLGPGGANMLYKVSDTDRALPVILDILAKNGLDKKTAIARRLHTSADEWFYEIIHPLNFTGVFLTL